MTLSWKITDIEYDVGEALLTRSASLLENPVPLLRWYVPTDCTVVLGRGQKSVRRVEGWNEVVRPSGGGAVRLSPELLSLDVVVPKDHPWAKGQYLADVFMPVGRAWLNGLKDLGLKDLLIWDGPSQASRLGTDKERALAEVCYASMGRGEIAVLDKRTNTYKKLVGLSQRQRKGGALIQCGIAHRWLPEPLIKAMGVEQETETIEEASIGIDTLLGRHISDEEIMSKINIAFTKSLQESIVN